MDHTTCTHKKTLYIDTRTSYYDTTIEVDDVTVLNGETEDPEEVEFPSEVSDVGVDNDSSGSYVTINMKVCLDCRRII